MATRHDARYWTDKAWKCLEAASEHASNGDRERAEMASAAYAVAVREAVARGARCFTPQEAR